MNKLEVELVKNPHGWSMWFRFILSIALLALQHRDIHSWSLTVILFFFFVGNEANGEIIRRVILFISDEDE